MKNKQCNIAGRGKVSDVLKGSPGPYIPLGMAVRDMNIPAFLNLIQDKPWLITACAVMVCHNAGMYSDTRKEKHNKGFMIILTRYMNTHPGVPLPMDVSLLEVVYDVFILKFLLENKLINPNVPAVWGDVRDETIYHQTFLQRIRSVQSSRDPDVNFTEAIELLKSHGAVE